MSAMTTERWVDAATTLGDEETQAIMTGVHKAARGDDEVEFLAVPQALVTRASGQSRGVSIAYGIRVARMNIAYAQRHAVPTDPANLPDVAVEAPGRPQTPYLEEILPRVSPTARKVLNALPAHILADEGAWARMASGSVKVNGQTIADALEITEQIAPASTRKGARQRRALLLLSCACWAEISEAMGNLRLGESKAQRAQRAHFWVKRGHSNRQARVTGAVFAPEVRVTVRGSRDMNPQSGEPTAFRAGGSKAPFTPSQDGAAFRSITYRGAAPVKRIRSPRPTDGVGEGVSWGGGGAVGMPSREVSDALKARRTDKGAVLSTGGREDSDAPTEWLHPMASLAERQTDRLDSTTDGAEWSDWQRDYAAGRLGVCPTVDDNGRCQCPRTRTRGTECEWIDDPSVESDDMAKAEQRARLLGEPWKRPGAWLHPLAECESPTPDGRCGCAGQRGALVFVNGTMRHPARPRRNR